MPCDADFYPDLHPHIHIVGHANINIYPHRDADPERLDNSVMYADVYLYGNTDINGYKYRGEYLNIYFDIHKYKDKHSVKHKYADFYENRNSDTHTYGHTGYYVYIYCNAHIYKYLEPDNHIDRFAFGYGDLDGGFHEYPLKYNDQYACKQRNIHFDKDKHSGKHAG